MIRTKFIVTLKCGKDITDMFIYRKAPMLPLGSEIEFKPTEQLAPGDTVFVVESYWFNHEDELICNLGGDEGDPYMTFSRLTNKEAIECMKDAGWEIYE